MLWFPLALIAAFCTASNDALTKRFFSNFTAFEMGFIRLLYALPYLIIGLLIIPWPEIDRTFWTCIATGLPLEVVALLSYMRAIKVSPLSLTLPFLAFTPAFVILTGYFLLGEVLTIHGLLGIFLIIFGSYALNISQMKEGWFGPFKAILREQGSWLMLLTAFLYSFTATLGKLAILHSSPRFFGVTYFPLLLLLLLCLFPLMPQSKLGNLVKRPIPSIISGLFFAGMVFSHTLAISLVEAAYMLAIFFKEKDSRKRFLGAAIMMIGVICIGVLG
jgi:drug/metabolite transporter (DMT)-like permease